MISDPRGPPCTDHYDVRCKVPSGLHRGSYEVTHVVATDYYKGQSKVGSLRVTR